MSASLFWHFCRLRMRERMEYRGAYLIGMLAQVVAYVADFLVIWVLWVSHHATMEHFRGYDEVLVRLHMLWLLTIVTLPFTTELLNSDVDIDGAVPLYIGTLLVSSLALSGISWRGRRHQELLHADHPDVQAWLAEPLLFVMPVIMALTLVLALVIPSWGTWPLLLLLVDGPIERLARHARPKALKPA